MLAHILFFRPRPDITPDDRRRLIAAMEAAQREIPTIVRFRIGRRVKFGAGYEAAAPDLPFAAILEFEDLAGLQAYLTHPAHEALGREFAAVAEQALVYDYELEDASAAALESWA